MRALAGVLRLGRAMNTLLLGIFLFHAGWYLILPFFAILFTTRRGLSPAEAGLLLATQSFMLLAGSLVGGWLGDRLGLRTAMMAGLLARGTGLGLLGLVAGLPALLLAISIAGVGGGLYGPTAKAGIAALGVGAERTTAFAARGIAANVGTSLGPLLGGLLIRGSMPLLFGVSAALHFGLALVTLLFYREKHPVDAAPKSPWWSVLTDRAYVRFSLVTVLAWALFAQLAIAVPLYAKSVLGLESSIGLLWTATSLTVILFQLSVTRFATSRFRPMTSMALGALLLGGGLGLVSFVRGFPGLLLAVLLFILGEMLLMPTADAAVSQFADEGALASYFGIATLTWGLGEGLGNLSGGLLLQYSLANRLYWLPWAIYAAFGLATGGLYWLLGRASPNRQPAEATRIQIYRPGQPSAAEGRIEVGGSPSWQEEE